MCKDLSKIECQILAIHGQNVWNQGCSIEFIEDNIRYLYLYINSII